MLITSGAVAVGDVRYASTLVFEREFRIYVEERRRAVWDTRFVTLIDHEVGKREALYFVLDGWLTWHDASLGSIHGPGAFVASQNVIDGMAGPAFTHSAGGSPFRSVQLRRTTGPALADGRPRPIDLPPPLLAAVREVAAAAASSRGLEEAVTRLLDCCHESGLTERALSPTIVSEESARMVRIWSVLRASHVLLASFPALEGVVAGAGISVRHISRAIEELSTTFSLEWRGWREVVRDLRLRWAVMLLSCESVSIPDAARSAGYGSVTALGTALRNVGLPPPREVRRLIGERLPQIDRA